jgi:hypothetical protein
MACLFVLFLPTVQPLMAKYCIQSIRGFKIHSNPGILGQQCMFPFDATCYTSVSLEGGIKDDGVCEACPKSRVLSQTRKSVRSLLSKRPEVSKQVS